MKYLIKNIGRSLAVAGSLFVAGTLGCAAPQNNDPTTQSDFDGIRDRAREAFGEKRRSRENRSDERDIEVADAVQISEKFAVGTDGSLILDYGTSLADRLHNFTMESEECVVNTPRFIGKSGKWTPRAHCTFKADSPALKEFDMSCLEIDASITYGVNERAFGNNGQLKFDDVTGVNGIELEVKSCYEGVNGWGSRDGDGRRFTLLSSGDDNTSTGDLFSGKMESSIIDCICQAAGDVKEKDYENWSRDVNFEDIAESLLRNYEGSVSKPIEVVEEIADLDKKVIAVYGIKATEGVVSQMEADALTSRLETALMGSGQYKIVSRKDMDSLADQAEFQLGDSCINSDDVSCYVELGGAAGANYIVTGEVTKFGDNWNLSVRLTDMSTAASIKGGEGTCKGEKSCLYDVVDQALEALR